RLDELAEPQLAVALRRGAAQPRPFAEVWEEDAQRSRLQLVQPGVVADEVEVHLVAGAVEAEHPHAVAELVVVDRDQAAVSQAEEVLRRIEAERRRDADSS